MAITTDSSIAIKRNRALTRALVALGYLRSAVEENETGAEVPPELAELAEIAMGLADVARKLEAGAPLMEAGR